jgi:hypothetical protein
MNPSARTNETKSVLEMQWFCPNCHGEGEIRAPGPNPEEPFFVVCGYCNAELAYLWCGHCGMGGQIGRVDRSLYRWTCDSCRQTGSLPVDFFDDPVVFSPKGFAKSRRTRVRFGEFPEGPLRNLFLGWNKIISNPRILFVIIVPFLLLILIYLLKNIFSFSSYFISTITFILLIPVGVLVFISLLLAIIQFPFWLVDQFRRRETRWKMFAAAGVIGLMVGVLFVLNRINYFSNWVLIYLSVSVVSLLVIFRTRS